MFALMLVLSILSIFYLVDSFYSVYNSKLVIFDKKLMGVFAFSYFLFILISLICQVENDNKNKEIKKLKNDLKNVNKFEPVQEQLYRKK